MTKEELIKMTFDLARKGLGTTWPNPMVGAVIVKDDKIIGTGFHVKKGCDHAEVEALKNCTESPEGATIYVNLEPCCHTNKTTPPCAQRLIKEKIKKVVISNLDPHPEVNGKGVELLRSHGIEVEHGLLSEEGEKLNEVFFLAQRKRRPFFHFKAALTLDGMTALKNGQSQWITGEQARAHVHELRSTHQAILTGGETVRKDNPRLTVRLPGYAKEQPYRIVLSRSKDLPPQSHLFTDEYKEKTLIYENIETMIEDLFRRNIISVMIESGPALASAFFHKGLLDRISLYQNPSFLGQGMSLFHELGIKQLTDRPILKDIESEWIGEDHYLTGRIACLQD